MFVNLFRIADLSYRFSKVNKKEDIDAFDQDNRVHTAEGETFLDGNNGNILTTLLNKDFEVSEKYINASKEDVLKKIVFNNYGLYTLKNVSLYLFSCFHIVSYTVLMFILGWYFNIPELVTAGYCLVILLIFSILVFSYENLGLFSAFSRP